MKLKALLAGVVITMASTAAQAQGTNTLFQIDDTSKGSITLLVSTNGGPAVPTVFQGETVNLVIPVGETIQTPFDLATNFAEPGPIKILSDTAELTGIAGLSSVFLSFHSDTEGGPPLTPLDTLNNLDETGGFQEVFRLGNFANGNTFTFEFASDAVEAIPEPATWAMMLLGLGGLGVAMRTTRRKSGAALAPA